MKVIGDPCAETYPTTFYVKRGQITLSLCATRSSTHVTYLLTAHNMLIGFDWRSATLYIVHCCPHCWGDPPPVHCMWPRPPSQPDGSLPPSSLPSSWALQVGSVGHQCINVHPAPAMKYASCLQVVKGTSECILNHHNGILIVGRV